MLEIANLIIISGINLYLCSGFSGFEITYSNWGEIITVTLSSKSGTVLLSPTQMQFWRPKWDKLSIRKEIGFRNEIKLVGCVDVVNLALQSIQYFGYMIKPLFIIVSCFCSCLKALVLLPL